MRFILEDEDESEEVELSFVEALKKWVKGGVSDDYLTDADSMIEVPWRKNQILARTKIKYQFEDDEDFLKKLRLNDDDIHFLKGINSSYGWEFSDSYGTEEDFKEGYGPISYFNGENVEKFSRICLIITGKEYDMSNPDTEFLQTILRTFVRPVDDIIDDFHWRKEEMMKESARRDTDKEINDYLASIGFELSREWDIVSTTPANLIMFAHLLRIKSASFEELFDKIVERKEPIIGGWWDNMYEFQDDSLFDLDGYNREVEKNLDRILEELEDNPKILKFYKFVERVNKQFNRHGWNDVPANKIYMFQIIGFDAETGQIKLRIGKRRYKNSIEDEKRIKISEKTFYNMLYQPTLFDLNSIFEENY